MSVGITIRKISTSPSATLLVWIGSFLSGITVVAIFTPTLKIVWATPVVIGVLALILSAAIFIKNINIRLVVLAGLFFAIGSFRFLSANDDQLDLLKYLPALATIKENLVFAVNKMLPEPDAGFVNGLLVGGGVRSPDLRAAFVATGTAHVMALSGWNITIINKWIGRILLAFRFHKKARWFLGTIGIIAFVIMTGASASLVRAAIMAMVAAMASGCGRVSAPGRAVLYASAIMLLVSPRIIVSDIGFLLSVAATLGMIYLSPFFEPFTKRLPDIFGFSGIVAGTLGATFATLPITLVAFGQSSLMALPANIFLLPFIAPTMGVGLICAGLSSLIPWLTNVCGWVVLVFTNYDISVVKLFSRVPGAAIPIPSFNWLAAVIMVIGMVLIVKKHYGDVVQPKDR